MGGTLNRLIYVSTLVSFFVIFQSGFGQTTPADTTQPRRVGTITETAPGLRTLVSIDAEDAYLPSVLSILAAKSGFNIVTGPGVSKEERITIHLRDVPIEEAMNLVVRAAGLSYDLVGNSFLIARAEKLREQVGLNSYVISLQYSDASEVAELLKDFNAKIQVDKSGNKLLVITTPQIITSIERVVANIDRPSLQISLSARMIEVQVEDEERLGINWAKLSTATSMFLFEGTVTPEVTTAGTQTRLQPFEPLDDVNKIGRFQRSMPIWEVAL
ncbi:MAG: secretin N-terminal domain-containing protein, partial [bacterium]